MCKWLLRQCQSYGPHYIRAPPLYHLRANSGWMVDDGWWPTIPGKFNTRWTEETHTVPPSLGCTSLYTVATEHFSCGVAQVNENCLGTALRNPSTPSPSWKSLWGGGAELPGRRWRMREPVTRTQVMPTVYSGLSQDAGMADIRRRHQRNQKRPAASHRWLTKVEEGNVPRNPFPDSPGGESMPPSLLSTPKS